MIKNKIYGGLFLLILIFSSSCSQHPHSSTMTHYVLEQERAPAKPIARESLSAFAEYKPQLYVLAQGLSPFGLRVGLQQNELSLLESISLNQMKMVGTIYFDKESWGLISLPSGMIERVKAGMRLGAEGGKIVAVTPEAIVVEEALNSSLKINVGERNSVRRTELRLV